MQAYEGVCIARSGGGLHESFTVRKISYGEGVERVFPIYSPMIDSIKVVRRGAVRRAKLYYLRDRRGKSARIAERTERPDASKAPGRRRVSRLRKPREPSKRGRSSRAFSLQGRLAARSRRLSRAPARPACACAGRAASGTFPDPASD